MRADAGGRSRTRPRVRREERRQNVSAEESLLSHDASNRPVNACEERVSRWVQPGARAHRYIPANYIYCMGARNRESIKSKDSPTLQTLIFTQHGGNVAVNEV